MHPQPVAQALSPVQQHPLVQDDAIMAAAPRTTVGYLIMQTERQPQAWPRTNLSAQRRRLLTGCLLSALPLGTSGQERPVAAAGIFRPLRVGQKVTVADKPPIGLEIRLLNEGTIGTHLILEIASSHIVLEDISALSRIWIPATAIRSVTWTRVPDSNAKQIDRQ